MVFPSRLHHPESKLREPLVLLGTMRATLHLRIPERVCSIIETDTALRANDGYSILRAMGLYASIVRQWNPRPLQSTEENAWSKASILEIPVLIDALPYRREMQAS